jgi:hypothetical protein
MATAKPGDPGDVPAETPVKPSKARERFLAGEIGWNEYVALESAVEPEAETKPPKSGGK